MSIRSWFSGRSDALDLSTNLLDGEVDQKNLKEALWAANHIFDDDLGAAEAALRKGSSSFHTLGMGLITFIKATLGFEQNAMKDASEWLSSAEVSAMDSQKRALRGHHSYTSDIYTPGSEFALCCAEAQLMGALVGVLNESLTESLKGFYKMRKAYLSLESIIATEAQYERRSNSKRVDRDSNLLKESLESLDKQYLGSMQKMRAGYFRGDDETISQIENADAEEERFEEANEYPDGTTPNINYRGKIEVNGILYHHAYAASFSPIQLHGRTQQEVPFHMPITANEKNSIIKENPISMDPLEHGSKVPIYTHPVDVFIHSGASMCFGMLLLVLSIIPPVFARLLSIIGFQGDRDRGLRLLWQAANFDNVNGATAGLVLLSYYNTFIGLCDILPDSDGGLTPEFEGKDTATAAYPLQRLEALLQKMRQRYPKSWLWTIEEARMCARKRNLSAGIALLSQESVSPLKQVQALAQFEKSLQTLHAHEYSECTISFERCCDLNKWSHALYLFIAGCAQVQLYRNAILEDDTSSAARYKSSAEDLLMRAGTHTGKRKVFRRQLPLDAYVARKLSKWTERASTSGVAFVDAIGVTPCEEMTYHFGGFKKMNEEQIRKTLKNLNEGDRFLAQHNWASDVADESALVSLLRAAVLRADAKNSEAIDILQCEILNQDPDVFKSGYRENWLAPVAQYEMAANLWASREQLLASSQQDIRTSARETVLKAKEYLEKAARWETFDLEARMGMRIRMGQIAIEAWLTNHRK